MGDKLIIIPELFHVSSILVSVAMVTNNCNRFVMNFSNGIVYMHQ